MNIQIAMHAFWAKEMAFSGFLGGRFSMSKNFVRINGIA